MTSRLERSNRMKMGKKSHQNTERAIDSAAPVIFRNITSDKL